MIIRENKRFNRTFKLTKSGKSNQKEKVNKGQKASNRNK